MSRLGLAVVGLGMASKPHLAALRDLEDQVEVRWAASPTPARTQAVATTTGWPVINDIAAAIADPAVEAVLLLTPPNTHLDLARACYHAGKHLLVEKPLEVSTAGAEALVEEGERAGLTVGVVLQHRFRPASRRLKAILEEGLLGEVQGAAMAVPWWRPQGYYDEPGRGTLARDGGGVLMTQAIHTLDLFRWLLGPVRVVAARATTTALHRMEAEDLVMALLEIGGGAPATLSATTAFYPGDPEWIEMAGSLGTARLVGQALCVRHLDGREERLGPDAAGSGGGADPMAFSHAAHRGVLADFVGAIRDGREPLASGQEALATQRLIDEILTAAGRV